VKDFAHPGGGVPLFSDGMIYGGNRQRRIYGDNRRDGGKRQKDLS
jgi:hypothetical protein